MALHGGHDNKLLSYSGSEITLTYAPPRRRGDSRDSRARGGDCRGAFLPGPPSPEERRIILIECLGGSDKPSVSSHDDVDVVHHHHRADTLPICNALLSRGWSSYPIFYSDASLEQVKAELLSCTGYIVRINPGKYDGVTQSTLDNMLREVAATGVVAMSHPDAMIKMGAKDALVKIKHLSCGMPDTYAYYDIPAFKAQFPKSVATGVRVLKQNRGSQGEGIWVCKIKDGQEGEVTGATILDLQEAVDNHKEEKTIDEFMTFCEQYIVGENGQLVDQRFLPRIVEGEVRVNMIYETPVEIIHKKPAEGGISATLSSGAKYVSYAPDDPQFTTLMKNFMADLPTIMPSLGMEGVAVPLIWTVDFILGEKDEDGSDKYFVGEFNCSCVGITQQLHLAKDVADAAIAICTQSCKF